MWRLAVASDDEAIVSMCMALNAQDPSPVPVEPQQARLTLAKLRDEPARGRALICEVDGNSVGYALLISFWSNELGGEVCNIDELFVAEQYRGRGLGTSLFDKLTTGGSSLWPSKAAALALEVSPRNERARPLYQRLGFTGENLAMRRTLSK